MGEKCRYDGKDNYREILEKLGKNHNLIKVCPELLGGLPVPRCPAERRNGRVYMNDGSDVSIPFVNGSFKVLEIARKNNCKIAILKAKSPSCGSGKIYDGTFSHVVIDGDGVCAEILKTNGIEVFSDEDIEKISELL